MRRRPMNFVAAGGLNEDRRPGGQDPRPGGHERSGMNQLPTRVGTKTSAAVASARWPAGHDTEGVRE